MKNLFTRLLQPTFQKHWIADLVFAIMRFICGLILAIDFGASKFGMPWTPKEKNLGLFEVIDWFPEDIAAYGGIFALAPVLFAWLGAFSEAIGGLFLAVGLKTRVASFLIMCTMLVAIFFQKWGEGTWGMLPAFGFLWISIYNLYLGSGRFGLDTLVVKLLNKTK
ncbi:DoxX family protein [Flagellimonas allohymeniacidonis]|uniref:DoxX family protein n=1 Tax=Flagellimonas allohymeniacidonis TaxID=2517819 RepID=A0A4Q8QGQ6_9FLAO|nr:DoxX family protein [Allomuricauda hymeniacidonis]TAI48927.1 DoxX family protein [Allomuricauda hymeniacidonis]